jgi:hypothetical protein
MLASISHYLLWKKNADFRYHCSLSGWNKLFQNANLSFIWKDQGEHTAADSLADYYMYIKTAFWSVRFGYICY